MQEHVEKILPKLAKLSPEGSVGEKSRVDETCMQGVAPISLKQEPIDS